MNYKIQNPKYELRNTKYQIPNQSQALLENAKEDCDTNSSSMQKEEEAV